MATCWVNTESEYAQMNSLSEVSDGHIVNFPNVLWINSLCADTDGNCVNSKPSVEYK